MNLVFPLAILLGLVVWVLVAGFHFFWSSKVSPGPAPLGYGPTTPLAGLRLLLTCGVVLVAIALASIVDGTESLAFIFIAVGVIIVGSWLHRARKPRMGHVVLAATTIDVVLYSTFLITGYVGREAPGPNVIPSFPLDSAERASLTQHAQSLDWSDSAHAVMDVQFVDSMLNGVPVPTDIVGEIRSPLYAHRRDPGDIIRGRIVWRIKITNYARVPYPGGYHTHDSLGSTNPAQGKYLNLPPGTSYVWVDSLVMVTADSGTARAFIIPESLADSVRPGPRVTFHHHKGGFKGRSSTGHPNYWWNRSLARWTFEHGAGWTWSDCTSHGCCSM